MNSFFAPRTSLLREIMSEHRRWYTQIHNVPAGTDLEKVEKDTMLYQIKQTISYLEDLMSAESKSEGN